MYSLYVEQSDGDLRFLCETDERLRVTTYAMHWSNILEKDIVVIEQFADGATTVLATYKMGRPVPEIGASLPNHLPLAAGNGA